MSTVLAQSLLFSSVLFFFVHFCFYLKLRICIPRFVCCVDSTTFVPVHRRHRVSKWNGMECNEMFWFASFHVQTNKMERNEMGEQEHLHYKQTKQRRIKSKMLKCTCRVDTRRNVIRCNFKMPYILFQCLPLSPIQFIPFIRPIHRNVCCVASITRSSYCAQCTVCMVHVH